MGDESPSAETDGGTTKTTAEKHQNVDYLDREVNLLSPSTPFM